MAAGNGVQRSLGQIEGKLDSLMSVVNEHTRRQDVRLDSIDIKIANVADTANKRLTKVENKVHWWSGAAMTIGATIGVVFDGAWAAIHK
jgi:tetrahydromethanopterin S-methyltransferase subunit G